MHHGHAAGSRSTWGAGASSLQKRGTDSLSASGRKWMSGRAKRRCGRNQGAPRRRRACPRSPRVRSHCRFRNRGTEYVSEYGIKLMSGSTKRQCDRALPLPRPPAPPRPRPWAPARAPPRPPGTPPSAAATQNAVFGEPKRCKLAHLFRWDYSYKRLKLAQLLSQLGVFLTAAAAFAFAFASAAAAAAAPSFAAPSCSSASSSSSSPS